MIITELNGGLGNQMFQYALGRRLAIENNTVLKLDTSIFDTYNLRKYELCHFNITEKFLSKSEMTNIALQKKRKNILCYIQSLFKKNRFKVVLEKQFHFEQQVLSLRGNLIFIGYWQTEKYFKDIEDIIRKDFTLKKPLSNQSKAVAGLIARQHCPVSLHIRRGDYISNPVTNQYHGICSLEYYQECVAKLEQLEKDISIFVFSDDPSWVQEHLKLKKPMFFISHNGEGRAYEDMYLMSLCHHHIIANSSFSWWGAWLNSRADKIVFSPNRWFASPEHDTKDLIPPQWYKV